MAVGGNILIYLFVIYVRFILIMVCYSEPKCSNSCAKGYRLLNSFPMVPEKQFGFKTTDLTSGSSTFTFRLCEVGYFTACFSKSSH